MTADANKALLEEFVDAVFDQDRDRMGRLLTDDAVCHVVLNVRDSVPPPTSRDAVLEFMCGQSALFYEKGKTTFDAIQSFGDDDGAAMIGTMRATTPEGRPYVNEYAFFVKTRDGLIAEVRELCDTKFWYQQMAPGQA